MIRILKDNSVKDIIGLYAKDKKGIVRPIIRVYKLSVIVWEAILSVFGNGFWSEDASWSEDDAWVEN